MTDCSQVVKDVTKDVKEKNAKLEMGMKK